MFDILDNLVEHLMRSRQEAANEKIRQYVESCKYIDRYNLPKDD